jgi:uncharacterized membrane protein YkvA (DUF1232 family)
MGFHDFSPRRTALISKLKKRADSLKREAYALYFAARDPRVPWYAKVLMSLVLAYAFSPIDLIPDFIPVLGYLDDLLLVPLGIAFVIKMIPAQVMTDARGKAEVHLQQGEPNSRFGAIMVIFTWLIILAVITWLIAGVAMKKQISSLG